MQPSKSAPKVNRKSTNELRMPLAEWLFRMSEARVPYQARSLAVYAVVFKVTTKEELAALAGMDTVGRADKTYNKWKKRLADDGWVRITLETVGRNTTITVIPSVDTIPVTFTDIKARDPRKFYANQSYADGVESTDQNYAGSVEPTPDCVEVTHEMRPSCTPAPAQKENPSGLVNTNQLVSKQAEVGNTSAREGLAGLNGTANRMIEDIISWMHHGDEQSAKTWLTTTIGTFGNEITKQAYQKLGTDIAEGRPIARHLQAWTSIAQRMQRGEGGQTKPSQDDHRAMLQAQNEALRKENGWDKEADNG